MPKSVMLLLALSTSSLLIGCEHMPQPNPGYVMPQIQPLPQPYMMPIRPQVNCTSQRIGSQVYTNCQ